MFSSKSVKNNSKKMFPFNFQLSGNIRVLMFQQLLANKHHRLRDSKFGRVEFGPLDTKTKKKKKIIIIIITRS